MGWNQQIYILWKLHKMILKYKINDNKYVKVKVQWKIVYQKLELLNLFRVSLQFSDNFQLTYHRSS